MGEGVGWLRALLSATQTQKLVGKIVPMTIGLVHGYNVTYLCRRVQIYFDSNILFSLHNYKLNLTSTYNWNIIEVYSRCCNYDFASSKYSYRLRNP